MSKPVSLIVSNVMHDAADAIRKMEILAKAAQKLLPEGVRLDLPDIPTDIARKLLCEIAHEAPAGIVFKALEAVGAPASTDLISEGLQAVKDMQ